MLSSMGVVLESFWFSQYLPSAIFSVLVAQFCHREKVDISRYDRLFFSLSVV